jgi:hypothetical protein
LFLGERFFRARHRVGPLVGDIARGGAGV